MRLNTLNSNRFQVEFVIEFLDRQETFILAINKVKTLGTFTTDQMIILVQPGGRIPGPEAVDQQRGVGIVPLRLENMSDQVVRVDVIHPCNNKIGVNFFIEMVSDLSNKQRCFSLLYLISDFL